MIDWLVPHQANRRIIEATAERMGLPMERVMMTIHKYGNTTAATIPLCLWDYEPQLKAGDRLLLAAFGGGFTWAGAYVTWAYDGAKARVEWRHGNSSKRQILKRKGRLRRPPSSFLNRLARYFAPRDRHVVARGRAGVELARAADLLARVLDHLLPLRDPADGAGDREQHGEHRGREAHRLQRDARIEVDVRDRASSR